MMNSMCTVLFQTGFDESLPTFWMAYYGNMAYVKLTRGLGTAKKT
mgnify:CR=1 FL=1